MRLIAKSRASGGRWLGGRRGVAGVGLVLVLGVTAFGKPFPDPFLGDAHRHALGETAGTAGDAFGCAGDDGDHRVREARAAGDRGGHLGSIRQISLFAHDVSRCGSAGWRGAGRALPSLSPVPHLPFGGRKKVVASGNPAPSPRVGASMSMQVEIWSDVVCPWCYIG